ncbi:MAG: benzoate-CoA ligase family protein [Burkholderiaceae bacterium]
MASQRGALPERFNFAQHLLTLNAGRANKMAYRDDLHDLSYGELDLRVRRFAAALLQLGLKPEQRILLVMHDTIDLPVAFLGALFAGVIPVPVNTLLPADNYAYMIKHSDAQLVIVSEALRPVVEEALTQTGRRVPMVIAGKAQQINNANIAFDTLLATPPLAADHFADTHADQFAFWLYSSGSTGQPKGTVHSHANLYWTAELYGKPVLGLHEDDIVFSAAKLFFAYGLGNALTFPLSVGATTILMAERATPAAVFKRLTSERPSLFFGVPTLYVAMLDSDQLPAREQVALRLCASAGEALPREIGEKFHAHFGSPILDGLGSTEMLHIFLSNRVDDLRYGATGKPVPGYQLALRDEAGLAVASGEVGDLYIQGPSAALMYWTAREKTMATFQGSWVKSGDKYTMDADGYYHYAGRSDDMLKVSGQYVSPIEVEAALMGHEAVLECAVVGKADEQGLIKTVAYVVLRDASQGGAEMEAALKAFVKTRLTPHKYPREIVFATALPKTATGKIQRFKLRALDSTHAH